jgi:dTDP-4-amino-4,6-dideoxygalactose transaminase
MADEPYIVFGSPLIDAADVDAVAETLRSGWIGSGPRVAEFEAAFRAYLGAVDTVAVSSGSAALHLSMIAAGIGPGDEVITTPLTFAATANSIVHTGARPVFADVDRATMNIDPAEIEARVTARTRAIVPVHLAGRPCDMDAIDAVAHRHGLLVIEDAAHAIEAAWRGRKVGTTSPFTCFSFYVTKNMTTVEGGMVAVNDPALADRIRTHALHGLSADAWTRFRDDGYRHYEVVCPGFKYNMTDVSAALGLRQLERIGSWHERRADLWRRYDEAFAGLPGTTPAPVPDGCVHARHLYTLLVGVDTLGLSRDDVMLALHRRGIGTGVHYRSLHLHPYYRDRFSLQPDDFPNAAWISERTLSLPLSAKVTDGEAGRVVEAVRGVLGG